MEEEKIYDFESDWEPKCSGKSSKLIFVNKKRSTFYRIIDMEKQTIRFSDPGRIIKIVDINKVLIKQSNSDELKERFLPLINSLLDEIMPIKMPYEPQRIHAYIENFPGFDENYDDTLGVLYFWNVPTSKEITDKGELNAEMIPCKKFFRIMPLGWKAPYMEIDLQTYNDAKQRFFERQAQNETT